VITTRGKLVFVAESFSLPLARQLTALILDAQGSGEMRQAQTPSGPPDFAAQIGPPLTGNLVEPPLPESIVGPPLTGNLIHFLSDCGVMKAAVTAITSAARREQATRREQGPSGP
jgi:hypothetical protein